MPLTISDSRKHHAARPGWAHVSQSVVFFQALRKDKAEGFALSAFGALRTALPRADRRKTACRTRKAQKRYAISSAYLKGGRVCPQSFPFSASAASVHGKRADGRDRQKIRRGIELRPADPR